MFQIVCFLAKCPYAATHTKNMRVTSQNDLSAEISSKQLLDIGNGKLKLIKLREHFSQRC